ncbi:MAG: DNA polymerase III subunit beta [Candidatus Kerfeldbacteria bacterium]|nr:DNA polymerase III subunit beta [Candidatus Kerfeldbacteria bacterium]
MKFICTQENLARGLQIVNRAASKNLALPILNNVLIQAEPKGIILQTTNLELGITAHIRGKVEQPGRYTVQSRLLTDFVNLLEHERVTCELSASGLTVVSGHTRTTMKGISADEFPVLPNVADGVMTAAASRLIQRGLEGVLFAAANDESRPEISGVYLALEGLSLVLAATDSYRLAERRAEITQPVSAKREIIIPARAAQELLRLLSPDEAEITMTIGDNQALVRLGETEIVTRLIEGRYPDYQQIIPQQWQTKMTIGREALVTNIRAASLFCKPGINDLTIRVDSGRQQLVLQAANAQLGEHEARLETKVEGQDNTIVFNYRYLLEGLQSIADEEVILELTDSQAPGVIRGPSRRDELYLLMPIRQ